MYVLYVMNADGNSVYLHVMEMAGRSFVNTTKALVELFITMSSKTV